MMRSGSRSTRCSRRAVRAATDVRRRSILTSIAKCGSCGGAVGAARSRAYGGTNERALCYGCAKHHERGSAVCSVTVHQPMAEVDAVEQKRLAKAVAMADDVPELVSELRKRSARNRSSRRPDHVGEADARARLRDLKTALADRRDLREVFLSLFPDGLTFTPARTPDGERQIW